MASAGISHAAEMPAPAAGTAAAAALKANAERRVTRIDKMVKLHKRKPPTKISGDGNTPIVVPGKLITRENDMYVMTIGMMLGLRVSLYYNATNADEAIKEKDVHSGDHYLFPPEGCSKPGLPHTPRHHLAHTFKFKDYAPKIFHRIRLLSGIDTKSYMDSVSGDANFVQFTSNSKSGQFFFFTPDGDYMVKTVSHEEVKELLKVLPQYYNHLREQPSSFLCRVLGMYRVQMYQLHRTVYFIVMASTWKGAKAPMDAQYDCKGSQVGRSSAVGDSVRKDNDLLEDGFRLRLGANREPVLKQLRSDVELLRSLGFLDYSLLIGAQWKKVGGEVAGTADEDGEEDGGTQATAVAAAATQAPGEKEEEGSSPGSEGPEATATRVSASASAPVPLSPPSPSWGFFGRRSAARNSLPEKPPHSPPPAALKEIDEAAFAEMAADLETTTQSRTVSSSGGGGDSGDAGGGNRVRTKTIDQVADLIYAPQAVKGSSGGKTGRRPSLADLHLDPLSVDPHNPSQAGALPSGQRGSKFVASPHGPMVSPESSPPSSPPAKGSGQQRPAAFKRRVSSRTLMLEYTRRWEKSVAPSGALAEEAVLAAVVRDRICVDSEVRTNQFGGLPAAPLPLEAPWVLPTQQAAAADRSADKSEGSEDAAGTGRTSSTESEGKDEKLSKGGKSSATGEDGEKHGEGIEEEVQWSVASPMARSAAKSVDQLDDLASQAAPVDGPSGEEALEYRLGVIDFLTKYGLNKMAERSLKSFKYEKKGLSVAPPDEYAARLVAFVEGICVGDAPCEELGGPGSGAGYLVQLVFKQAGSVGLELGNKSSSGLKMEAAWKSSGSLSSRESSARGSTSGHRNGGSGSSSTDDDGGAAAAAAAAEENGAGEEEDDGPHGHGSHGRLGQGGVVVLSVREGSPGAVAGVRAGDRVQRINSELVPRTLQHRMVSDRLRKASRPLYLTLERCPTLKAKELAREREAAEAAAAAESAAHTANASIAEGEEEEEDSPATPTFSPPATLPPPLPPPPPPPLSSSLSPSAGKKEEEEEEEEDAEELLTRPVHVRTESAGQNSFVNVLPDVSGRGEEWVSAVFGSPLSSPKVVADQWVEAAVAGVGRCVVEKRSRNSDETKASSE